MAPFVVDELAAGAEDVVDPLVPSELALALALALEAEAEAEVPPAVPVVAPMAACWKAAKVLLAVGLMAKTIPC